LLGVGPAAYIGVRKGVRDGFDAELIMYLGLIVGLLLTPLVAGPRVSSYRSYALLGPVVVLLMGVPERLRLIVICACAGVASLLAFVYFRGNLI